MRRAACVLAVLLACAACTRSGGEADAALHADLPAEGVGYTAEFSEQAETETEASGGYAAIDLDLTGLSPTMLYAEVSQYRGAEVAQLLRGAGFADVAVLNDSFGNQRFALAVQPAQ